jgi:protein TonB
MRTPASVLREIKSMRKLCIILLAVCSGALVWADDRIKIGEKEARQAVVTKEDPAYPSVAKQLKITGQVTIEVVVDGEGNVEQCDPIVGNPVLTGAAMKAVKAWRFKPFKASGKASRAVTRLTFDFPM